MTTGRPPSWRSAVRDSANAIASEREARWIIEHVTGWSVAGLAAALDEPADPVLLHRVGELVDRRRRGEPLQHVLGEWSFRSLELTVDRRALVPRPETEVVVEHALGELARSRRDGADERGFDHRTLRALDLGTGSGAIACALVAETSDVEVIAIDSSADALDLARVNRDALGGAGRRIELREGSWYEALGADLHGSVDCIVANPPYLAAAEWAGLEPVVRDHDPYGALVAGPTGLEAYEVIVAGAPNFLAPHGALVLEIAPSQAEAVRDLARGNGASEVELAPDLAGRTRVVVARWPRSAAPMTGTRSIVASRNR
jgi:release factor glutamine methyltransferase